MDIPVGGYTNLNADESNFQKLVPDFCLSRVTDVEQQLYKLVKVIPVHNMQ